ncbi:reverse transcriptase domain-containing protein [Tanacetum coccineum]|uniref:Reverse transcriptase domain-containing protein n=1 Tax=Tanacetum coccineum TaxID=301880 RepID=A0ABQ5DMY6_9ASTR
MELYDLLRNNFDIFAWKPMDMTGVPRSIAEHRLNVREGCAPIRQKKKGQAPERNKDVQEESQKLDEDSADPLTMACNPPPTTQYGRVSSLFATPQMHASMRDKGYYQIQMAKADEEKTVFHTIIKSHTEQEILRDIEETFQTLRKINMKLNPKKCTFGVEEGMFLSHVVNMKGIKACPEKAEAVIKLQSLRTLKEPREHEIPHKQKWKFELEAFDITYRPRTSIRGQVLADFIAERPEEDGPPIETQVEEAIREPWTLFTDGLSCQEGSGAEPILTNLEGLKFTYALRFEFDASNNEAEYEALVAGLRIADQMGVQNLEAKVDSRLVANQIN